MERYLQDEFHPLSLKEKEISCGLFTEPPMLERIM